MEVRRFGFALGAVALKGPESVAWTSLLSWKQPSVGLLPLVLSLLHCWLSLPEAHPHILAPRGFPLLKTSIPALHLPHDPSPLPQPSACLQDALAEAGPNPSLRHMGWAPPVRGGHRRWAGVCMCVRACLCVCVGTGTPGMALSMQGGRDCGYYYFLVVVVLTPNSCSLFLQMEHSFSLFLNLCSPAPAGVLPALGGLH